MKKDFLYEGKAKKLYTTDDPHIVLVIYKDDATAFNRKKTGTILNKGVVNNRISNHFFQILAGHGIPTHFIEELSERETLVKRVEIIPAEVIVRNQVAGSMARRLGLEEGHALAHSTIEFSYKKDELDDPLMADSYLTALNLCSQEELDQIKGMAFRINEILQQEMLNIGIKLIDFKLEFGRTTADGQIVLADEISPDTCRFWDAETHKKLDKDRFRHDLGGVEEAYQEMYYRLLGKTIG
ncbi:MAG: phosphoribosylaminoimidazolesuccinocarboxamide synthase [Gemmatimonadetes bacterium]|nr:MAG: phosphoribosylaminoimidazolesuccinocarboxamide synthase [Gemmatimonadota bacterium]